MTMAVRRRRERSTRWPATRRRAACTATWRSCSWRTQGPYCRASSSSTVLSPSEAANNTQNQLIVSTICISIIVQQFQHHINV
uniref:Uncharacterized protein n=1 Tax=Oryza barthii TaxID=65489 RepID=A0A0D3FRZ5_9ORYZ